MKTQIEVEEGMYLGGIMRARATIANNEEAGEAGRNTYAATIYRDFVVPLAQLLEKEFTATGPGRFGAHIALLRHIDPATLAYLTVRRALSRIMDSSSARKAATVRAVAYDIGSTVHQELVLDEFAEQSPELYHTLARDFARRHTKSTRHRLTVFKMQAKKAGIAVPEWGVAHRDIVGLYLLGHLNNLGMVVMESQTFEHKGRKVGRRDSPMVHMHPDVMDTIDKINGLVEVSRPLYGPCVEPPLPWTRFDHGGFHTEKMRRRNRYLVKAPAACRALFQDAPIPKVLAAVNALQRTAWAVNTRVLDALTAMAVAGVEFGELIAETSVDPQPAKPAWLDEEVDKTTRTAFQEAAFTEWKHGMSAWYTRRKLRGAIWGRYRAAIQTARTFAEYQAVYFAYFLDSRGRAYPLTYGVSPQGSDIQKALLQFATAKPLPDKAATDWFLINGANRWGFDKAALADRARWHIERRDLLIGFADDPVNNGGWREADKPLQFLAWCFEYADWCRNPDTFVSRQPVGLDGSCNGLQHFSAMLRDGVGGEATNLRDLPVMQDIYARVALSTIKRIKDDTSGSPWRDRWLAHGITRGVVKRSVMTTPYGVTKASAVKYVIEDYLKPGGIFEQAEHREAATFLMGHAWAAIGDVVTKSREAMDWLSKAAKRIVKSRGEEDEGVVSWITPSGFIAGQAYYDLNEYRVDCRLFGGVRLSVKVVGESDDASPTRHASGMAPNFVHSMDAAHMHLVAAAAESLGIDALAMIHDDFGTHAADTQRFFMLIRTIFVDMYREHDPLMELRSRYPELPEPPPKGDLDIEEVLASDFFFS